MAQHTYSFDLHQTGTAATTGEEPSPVVRVLTAQALKHPLLLNCDATAQPHVHLWLVEESQERSNWNEDAELPCLILKFKSAQGPQVQAMQDLVFALQCDGVHSVLTNADLPDLAELFAPNSPWSGHHAHRIEVGCAIAAAKAGTVDALQAAWQQLQTQDANCMLVLRAHAPEAVNQTTAELRQWHSTLPGKPRMLCWDVYDPALQAGQSRYTLLVKT